MHDVNYGSAPLKQEERLLKGPAAGSGVALRQGAPPRANQSQSQAPAQKS